ncbi:hypothetical protein JHK82_024866 [Glycine max]|nr:hypothetical protein JHK86_024981 [Glycine max]KAG5133678.1 hypothetical protein JHK82_024866 [Glycine max]
MKEGGLGGVGVEQGGEEVRVEREEKCMEASRARGAKKENGILSVKLLDDKEVQYLPAYHDIPADDHNRILLLSKVCCLVSLIIKVLELEKGIDADNLSFLEKDIKNFIQSQHSIEEENEGTEVLKLCKSLKDKDDAFQYDFTLDENNKLEHIIWVFGDSIRAYEAFGDAVGVDVTIRNQAGEEARMRKKYHNPSIRTSFPIEEHVATILTPYAFELLQHEIELSTKYAATKTSNDSYTA